MTLGLLESRGFDTCAYGDATDLRVRESLARGCKDDCHGHNAADSVSRTRDQKIILTGGRTVLRLLLSMLDAHLRNEFLTGQSEERG